MANIRKLQKEFKDVIKQAETCMNELFDIVKSKKPKSLIFLAGGKLVKTFWEYDLLLVALYCKMFELTIKLQEEVNTGTVTLEQTLLTHDLLCFAERMHEEHTKFYAHNARRIAEIQDVDMGKITNYCIPKFEF